MSSPVGKLLAAAVEPGCSDALNCARRDESQLDPSDDAAVNEHARALGVPSKDVRDWILHGGCGQLGEQMLERLRPSGGTAPEFSVGFVSVLAGVLLAGQVIKDAYFGTKA